MINYQQQKETLAVFILSFLPGNETLYKSEIHTGHTQQTTIYSILECNTTNKM